jgi:hypothetical protein
LSCYGSMTVVVNVRVKRRGGDRVMWGLDRRAQANLWVKHRNRARTTPKPGFTLGPGKNMAGYLPTGHVGSGAEEA